MQIAARSRLPLELYVAGVGADAVPPCIARPPADVAARWPCAGDLDLDECLIFFREKSDTVRRYDRLWTRVGLRLPLVATQQISTHWLRHATLMTWVEGNFG
jgi:hypothetical protein